MEVDEPGNEEHYEEQPVDEEGEGDDAGVMDDSSEEGEDDEEEAERIKAGFIVDSDNDDEEGEPEDDEEEERRRRKRRKRHHRRHHRHRDEPDEDDLDADLDQDDLDLVAESTGRTGRLHRLRKASGSASASPPPTAGRRRNVVEDSDDDLDDDVLPQVQDIQRIFDDVGEADFDDADDDMDAFIDYDEMDGAADEQTREERRRKKRQELLERKKARATKPALVGLDASAWVEIHDVFGDGHDYDWALASDEEHDTEERPSGKDMKWADVFEPTQITARYLTEDDGIIRSRDIPERLQLATSTLSKSATLFERSDLVEEDLGGAAYWVIKKLPQDKTQRYFAVNGDSQPLQNDFVMAVQYTLKAIFVDHFEVPYIWSHRRDYISHFDIHNVRERRELLSLTDLWRIHSLGNRYRSLIERRKGLFQVYDRLGVEDEYFVEEVKPAVDSIEMVADAIEWLSMKYRSNKKGAEEFMFQDDMEPETAKKHKMPSRVSAYEVARKGIYSRVVQGFGIHPHQVVLNFLADQHLNFINDHELHPVALAEQYADPDNTDEALRQARLIVATELGRDPLLRNQMRRIFQDEALVSVEPTERGINKINEQHPYFNFKYLSRKPLAKLSKSPLFLHMQNAENEHLVKISIFLSQDSKSNFENRLCDAFSSDSFSESATAWNEERRRAVREALEQFLIPSGSKWAREYLREEAEDYLARECGELLRLRVDVAPYKSEEMSFGEVPSVLAVSWGKGDPLKDAIILVFVDKEGRMREHAKLDNLVDQDARDEFMDLVKSKSPDVIVVGGFSMATVKLSQRVKQCLAEASISGWHDGNLDKTPVVYVKDDVARLYQHSARAEQEFPSLPPTAKYCVGLGRFTQSPLIEFAALGSDISAITVDALNQHLVPPEKLLVAFERVIVDVTNKVGVDINRAMASTYYQALLPYVCGLGPRKATALVRKIGSLDGSLSNRSQFVTSGLLSSKIFVNAAGFLRIVSDHDYKAPKLRQGDEHAPDPLDNTRIHPEDYDYARKMAAGALELDEEDVVDDHPSQVITAIMNDPDSEKKLNELSLDEFAVTLYEASKDQKRYTLNVIRSEILHPFKEERQRFEHLTDWEILTMLSGETPKTEIETEEGNRMTVATGTLGIGYVVSASVFRITPQLVNVKLSSEIEGTISLTYLADTPPGRPDDVVKKGQTLPCVVVDLKLDAQADHFAVELSSRPHDVKGGDSEYRKIDRDQYWDRSQEEKDNDYIARKKRAEVAKTRKAIKHPNFHNFNSAQAEAYLDKQERGDVVVRPSSKGIDHLAVTWKVDEGLYQHIDVTEVGPDQTGQGVGGQLFVDKDHVYADLDELIVNHVQAMARRVEELMAHERFKPGSEDELHVFLKNVLAANPAKSMYGFTLNRKRPGHFSLCFLANKQSSVQTWPVRVAPEAYYLFDAYAVGVPELCDAFKVRHLHESQNSSNVIPGRTPYGAGHGGRTPARPGATPAGARSVRQPARTPNPYGGGTTPRPAFGGAVTPRPPMAAPSMLGYQTPSQRAPPGMNPQRAAMIQGSQGGWGQNSGSAW